VEYLYGAEAVQVCGQVRQGITTKVLHVHDDVLSLVDVISIRVSNGHVPLHNEWRSQAHLILETKMGVDPVGSNVLREELKTVVMGAIGSNGNLRNVRHAIQILGPKYKWHDLKMNSTKSELRCQPVLVHRGFLVNEILVQNLVVLLSLFNANTHHTVPV
jgi:hypothetical protein